MPAILSYADALALAPQVDHILMVVSAGSTPLSEVKRALTLPAEKVLGLVLNKYEGEINKKGQELFPALFVCLIS